MINQAIDIPCTVRKIRFERELFSICEMETSYRDIPQDACIDPIAAVARGEAVFVALGEGIRSKVGAKVLLSGVWEPNKKFGCPLQLRVTDCRDHIGEGKDAVVAYLSSGLIKGIGKKTAELIYDQFGDESIHILEDDPKRLLAITGIKQKKLEKIIASYIRNQDFHALARLLAPLGLSSLTIKSIAKKLGKGAAAIIRHNPYELCKVRGFSFLKADALARSLGAFANSKFRIAGGVIFTLDKAQNSGHLFLQRETLCKMACAKDVLNCPNIDAEIIPAQVDTVIDAMLKEDTLKTLSVSDDIPDIAYQRIYLPSAYTWERTAAQALRSMLNQGKSKKTKEEWETIVRETEDSLSFALDDTQRAAAVMALSSPVSVITGGPGTGKTSSLHVLVESFIKEYPDAEIALAAPTGRAARRMSEQIGMDASTLHHLLGLRPDEHTDFDEPCAAEDMLDADLLVVDESSMIDAELMANLMYRVSLGTQILFLGDADQLPSVGPGNVLRQLLSCPAIPSTRLTRIFRQKEDSLIPYNAANIRQGIPSLTYSKKDFFLKKAENEGQALSFIKALMQRSIDIGISDDVQILCPMRYRGAASTNSINEALRDVMNPPSPDKAEIEIGNKRFRVGDKVMQTRNIDGAANGDIGFVSKVYSVADKKAEADMDVDDDEEYVLAVQFYEEEPAVKYTKDDAFNLEMAYAITIHKSQGSEFPKVIIPLFNSMYYMLRRNLFYTAVTRAREQVILVSDENALIKAIETEDTSCRNTVLGKLVSGVVS